MITLSHISKSYPLPKGERRVILDDVSYTFKDGENTGILGLNGCGKSTLMRIIYGSEAPDSGKVIRTGRVSWPIGFTSGFHSSLTGRENMRFTCRIYGVDIAKVTAFVEDFAEIGPYMDMPIHTYSGSMKSKLAFGLSMAIGFDFYLLDEKNLVGDAAFRKKSEKIFRECTAKATCIIATRSASLIKRSCDKAMILHNGKLHAFHDLHSALVSYRNLCEQNYE